MPFTPSHVAAALPFLRTPLLPAALVIGSMAPDVPYFVPLGLPRDLTHSLVGVPTADLAITLVLFALWYAVLRSPIIDLAPAALRERMPGFGLRGWRPRDRTDHPRGWTVTIVLVIASALVGILTHLAWDAFTHRDSPLVIAWPALQTQIGPFHAWTWLQHFSTVTGLVILAVWTRWWVRRMAPIAGGESRVSNRMRAVVWLVIAATFVGTGFVVWLREIAGGRNAFDGDVMFEVATRAGGATGLVVVLIAAGWWAVYRRPAPRA